MVWPARNMSFQWTTVTTCRTQTAPHSGTQPEFPNTAFSMFAISSHRLGTPFPTSRLGPPLPSKSHPHLCPLLLPPSPSQVLYLHCVTGLIPCLPSFPLKRPPPRCLTACVRAASNGTWTKQVSSEFIINESTVNQAPETRNLQLSTEMGAPRRLFQNPHLSLTHFYAPQCMWSPFCERHCSGAITD